MCHFYSPIAWLVLFCFPINWVSFDSQHLFSTQKGTMRPKSSMCLVSTTIAITKGTYQASKHIPHNQTLGAVVKVYTQTLYLCRCCLSIAVLLPLEQFKYWTTLSLHLSHCSNELLSVDGNVQRCCCALVVVPYHIAYMQTVIPQFLNELIFS